MTVGATSALLLASGSAIYLSLGCERALGLSERACRDARRLPVFGCGCLPLAVLLIVLPTQRRAIDVVCAALALNGLAIGIAFYVDAAGSFHEQRFAESACVGFLGVEPVPCACAGLTLLTLLNGVLISAYAAALYALLLARRRLTSRQRLDAMWYHLGAIDLFSGVPVPACAFGLKLWHGCAEGMGQLFVEVVSATALGLLLMRPHVRVKAHAFFSSNSEATAAASGIASVISGRSAAELHARAVRLFRGIRLDRVTYADMSGDEHAGARAASASARAEPREFLGVDAFISHAWSDPPLLKWAALQAWRAQFVRERGREPFVFIDSLCMSQTSAATIAEELECLPLWLAGCSELPDSNVVPL